MNECVWGFFFVKQKTAYEMRISDWSSDVCSSDLTARFREAGFSKRTALGVEVIALEQSAVALKARFPDRLMLAGHGEVGASRASALRAEHRVRLALAAEACRGFPAVEAVAPVAHAEAHIRFGEDIGDIAIDVAR